MTNNDYALQIKNLSKKFKGITAIAGITLNIEKGKIVGFIGPDGAGKTTLLRLLCGLFQPTSGSILLEGIDIFKNPHKAKERLGYMPQQFSLYGDLTVAENLKFFADLYGLPQQKFKARKEELLNFSGLAPFANRLARNLSGGMQKKLALACNLFHTPHILLLDEPTTGVDPVSRKELWQLLAHLNHQGVTIIITTPYMDESSKCHQVGLIYEGRILRFQPPQRLIKETTEEILELRIQNIRYRKILKEIPNLKNIYALGESFHLVFEAGVEGQKTTEAYLKKKGIQIKSLKKIEPSFEDVFFSLVEKERRVTFSLP
ncbi:MAG: ABC transporter ATP-binding protein [Candidatus Aminicenantales bacterium]